MTFQKSNIKIYLAWSVIVLMVTGTGSLYSQSDNYWSWSFNTHSTLLAGSVVGGSAGPSSIFYNPALIDHENLPSLSISANILSLQFFNAENIAGDGINADKLIFKIQPRFLSYVLPGKNEKFGMEVAILSPVSEEINYTIQHDDELDIIQRMEGLETYSGYLKYSRKYDDTWAGFGVSYKISNRFFIGASSFLSIKLLKYQYRKHTMAYQDTDSIIVNNHLEPKYIAQSSFEEEMKYWNLSFIFKVGGLYKTSNDRFSIGANITFPDIPFIGQADIRKAYMQSNIYNNDEDEFTPNESLIEKEEKVKSRVKNPFSTAIGIQYFTKNKKNMISLTIEYFHHIDSYAIAETSNNNIELPEYFEGLIDETAFMSYYHEANSVTNVAIGFKQFVSESFFFMGGFRTDFTSGTSDNIRFISDKFKINQIHINKYHFSVGPVLKIKQFNILTGVQYTYGMNKTMGQAVNYANPVEYIPATGQSLEGLRQNNAVAKINELALFFGVTVDLK
jgi:hypothetical protein